MNRKPLRISLAVLVLSGVGQWANAEDLSRYTPNTTPTQKSDFDRAMEQAPERARQPPPYTPPDPHEGRIPVPGHDLSVGGGIDPPSVNVRTTTP